MADLENLLLEAAGIKGGSGKRKREASLPEEGEYSGKSDDSDDDSDDERDEFVSQRRGGSHVPLKKRLDKEDGRETSHGDDEDSDCDSFDSDLYRNDADREALSKMSELDRENILYERSVKRNDNKLKKAVRATSTPKKSGKKASVVRNKKKSPSVPSRGRSTGKSAKDRALNGLRKKQSMKQQIQEGQCDRMQNVIAGVEETNNLMQIDDGSDVKDRVSSDGEDMVDSDEEIEDSLSYDDVKDITIQRSKLAKWFTEPFFEELIAGCFVRVGIGMSRNNTSMYRLCLVRNVDASDPSSQYKLMNKTTHKYLNCIWGSESSAARWQMARVSESPPTMQEFGEWVREVERCGERMPTPSEVAEKIEAINKLNDFVYSAETVKQMLEEKKLAPTRRLNVAVEKERLRREMEIAESRNDEAEVAKIRAQLKELEASRHAKEVDSRALKLSEMNRKNREENFKNASLSKPVMIGLKAGEAGYDPLSRRWTQSRNYYMSKSQEEEGSEARIVGLNGQVVAGSSEETVVEPVGKAATEAALEAAAGAGKLVDTRAPVDHGTALNALHDFELPLSLAGLEKFGVDLQGIHSAMMARKQRIEATIGSHMPENDGRCHALTLTLTDYKRRQGLL